MKLAAAVLKKRSVASAKPVAPVAKVIRGTAPKASVTVPVTGKVIGKENVDKHSAYNAHRVPMAEIAKKNVIGKPIPAMKNRGYLMTRGDKPGVLLREVSHDGASFYRLAGTDLYGNVEAMNKAIPAFKAEIISKEQLLALAKKFNHPIEVTKVSDKSRLQVWLLNDFGDQYVAGVTMHNGNFQIVNMEHPAHYNKKDVQFTDPKAVKLNFDKFFAKA